MSDDPVNSPEHYNVGNVECIDAIEAAVADFPSYCQGNAIKYLYRHAYKGNPVQDLEKAIWYINKLKEQYEDKQISRTSNTDTGSEGSASSGRAEQDEPAPSTWDSEIPCTD